MFSISRTGFVLFGLDIRWYGVLIALGVFLAVRLAGRREKRLGLPRDAALDVTLIGLPLAIICARLYFVAFSWDFYGAHPEKILSVHEGGLAIYGGLLGGMLGGWLYARHKKLSFLRLADLAAPSFALGQAIGRWGNFLNQEAYGAAVADPALRFFPLAVFIPEDGLWHWATFFFESAWCFAIVAILLVLERRRFFRKSGDILCWYAVLYAAERMVVEGLRTDSLYWGAVRVSQALSLAVLAGVCVLFAIRAKRLSGWGRALAAAAALGLALLLALGVVPASVPYSLGIAAALVALSAGLYGGQADRERYQ